MKNEQKLIGYDEAAKLLCVKRATLYQWVHHEKIPHYRMSGKMVRFDPGELLAWVKARLVPAQGKEVTR